MQNTKENILEVKNLSKTYSQRGAWGTRGNDVFAVKNVNLEIKKGEVFGLVGESGCGKSTLCNCVMKLLPPTSGEILFEGKDICTLKGAELKVFRQNIQLIFQNPFSSLNPKMKIKEILLEPLVVHGFKDKKVQEMRLNEILEFVGLSQDDLVRYPHEFSGGQRQRIAIARALILKPKFIVADEPVSALDVSIQAQIINLLIELKQKFDITYLFISHDLNVVRYICDKIAIMHEGEIVESGSTEEIFNNPKMPYTQKLLGAIPRIEA